MGNCLVTKLKGSVNNNYLPKIGELIIDVNNAKEAYCEISNNWSDISYRVSDGVTLVKSTDKAQKITGTGRVFLSGASTNKIVTFGSESLSFPNLVCDFTKELHSLNISNTGNDTPISKCRNSAILKNTNIIGRFSDAPNIANIQLANCTYNGGETLHLEEVLKCKNITSFQCNNGKLAGDISVLNADNFPYLLDISFYGNKDTEGCYGDIAKLLPNKGKTLFFTKSNKGYTWSDRPSTSKILCMAGCNLNDNVDKMLINQATLQAGDSYNYKIIEVIGNRTSASDEAVATLQSKGISVSVTPA